MNMSENEHESENFSCFEQHTPGLRQSPLPRSAVCLQANHEQDTAFPSTYLGVIHSAVLHVLNRQLHPEARQLQGI